MNILFAAYELHFPDNMGGSRMDVHDLALALQERGHEVAVLATIPGRNRLLGYRALESLTRACLLRRADTVNGYETVRCGSWQVARVLREELRRRPPDLVITQGRGSARLAASAAGHGVPAILRITSAAEAELLAGEVRGDPDAGAAVRSPLVTLVAVSRFLATLTVGLTGLSPVVVYPPVRLEACAAADRRPDHITFVNPIPMKGRDLALRLAALLPHRQFVFVEAWNMRADERASLERGMSGLANVSLRPRSVGLAAVYRSTALLLVPSQCPEAFSRVVLEACASGIPVLASRVGGVPEAMGESGVLLDPADPAERWAEAIEAMLADPGRFRAAALANAQRAEFRMPFVAAQYVRLDEPGWPPRSRIVQSGIAASSNRATFCHMCVRSKNARVVLAAASPSDSRRAWSASRSPIRPAISAGARGGTRTPSTPSVTYSLMAGDAVVSVARPIDMASSTTLCPLGYAGATVGVTTRSAASSKRRYSSCPTGVRTLTWPGRSSPEMLCG